MRSIGEPFAPISRDIILYRDFYRLYDLAITKNPAIAFIKTPNNWITENWINLILAACDLSIRAEAYQSFAEIISLAINELSNKEKQAEILRRYIERA